MRAERIFKTPAGIEAARERAAAYLRERGFKPIGTVPLPLFQRGSAMGSLFAFSRKAVLTNVALDLKAGWDGATWGYVAVNADTRWQVYTAKGARFWEEELDGLVAAASGEIQGPEAAAAAGVIAPSSVAAGAPAMQQARARQQVRSGANWFFYIAGLSVLNTVLYRLGAGISFLVGLGATEVVEGFGKALAQELQSGAATLLSVFSLIIEILIAGIFVLLGVLARKGQRWAFWVGMVLYALDAVIYLLFGIWLPFGFHLFVLYMLYQGVRAAGRLQVNPVPAAASVPVAPQKEEKVP